MCQNRDVDGGFMEINNSWYIQAVNADKGQKCRYGSFDEFMRKYFEDYVPQTWIRFPPGSQFLITRENAVQYPKSFWEDLMYELEAKSPTEAHIIERALYYILTGKFKLNGGFN